MMNKQLLEKIEAALNDCLGSLDATYYPALQQAMSYSVEAGGKRLRPYLLLLCYQLFRKDVDAVLPAACAVEFVHTYSLIHDDLPCMDNDEMRRGKPSCHIAFGEDTALLAGDALLTLAFECMSQCSCAPANIVKAIQILSHLCGAPGMVGGQVLDLYLEHHDANVDEILQMYAMKTSALLQAACCCGAALAGAAEEEIAAVSDYAYHLGLAFQVQDDILDQIGTQEELGKPIGSDEKNQKSTFLSLRGLQSSKDFVREQSLSAKNALALFDSKADQLRSLTDQLINRKR